MSSFPAIACEEERAEIRRLRVELVEAHEEIEKLVAALLRQEGDKD